MQYAKDSFYMALRTRLALLYPERTVLIRGAVRPGILVEEAEAPFGEFPNDVFVLRWPGAAVEMSLEPMLVAAEGEFKYQTVGTQSFGGLDRGRMMSEMDRELLSMLTPLQAPKLDYSVTPPDSAMTHIFWEEPVFGPLVAQGDTLSRSATVRIYSYLEEGE